MIQIIIYVCTVWFVKLLLLLLLAVMTYDQVQLFQINNFANHYMDIEFTGHRVLYSESIAGRGVAILISSSGTSGPVDCFNRIYEEYSDFFQFLLVARVQTTLSYAPETRYTTNLYSCDHTCHILTLAHYPLMKQTSLKLPKII